MPTAWYQDESCKNHRDECHFDPPRYVTLEELKATTGVECYKVQWFFLFMWFISIRMSWKCVNCLVSFLYIYIHVFGSYSYTVHGLNAFYMDVSFCSYFCLSHFLSFNSHNIIASIKDFYNVLCLN